MSLKPEQFCKLCLKVTDNDCVDTEIMKQLFDILLLKSNLDITGDPIICKDCVEVAKNCLYFKFTCINTEINLYNKHDIKANVHYQDSKHDEDLDICRFCQTQVERNNSVSLNTLMHWSMFEMLTKYMPEMDINFTTSVICTSCKETLGVYFEFVQNSLGIVRNIKLYYTEKGSNSINQVNIGNTLDFFYKYISKYPTKCPQICATKESLIKFDDPGNVYRGIIKVEEMDIKKEEINLEENSYKYSSEMKLEKYNDLDIISLKTEDKPESCTCEKNTQGNVTEDILVDGNHLELKRNERLDKGICYSAMYTDKMKQVDNVNNSSIIENGSAETEKASIDPSHVPASSVSKVKLKHKCPMCTYRSKYKCSIKAHMLVHKDSSEIKMYKCSLCAYASKRKGSLKRHNIFVHKDLSETKMLKCPFCNYEISQNYLLKRHMLVHKDISEIKMHKCPLCSYESKRKHNLRTHNMLVHKNVLGKEMRKCAYESKQKNRPTENMLIHKDDSEMKMYKCSLCPRESKYKNAITRHMLVHKDKSEIKMHKCLMCPYEAKQKSHLNTHNLLLHKDISEIEMFKCSLCTYESKRKHNLELHMSVHKDASEIIMHKCSLCAYEAKQKRSVRMHMLLHTIVSEVDCNN